MIPPRITTEELNAYVDGELDPRATARVAAAIADDAGLARQVAALAQLRSALREGIAAPEISLPPSPAPRRRHPLTVAALAAVLVVAAVLAGQILNAPTGSPSWPDQLRAQHGSWTADTTAPTLADHAGLIIPDLSASKLRLAAYRQVQASDGRRIDLVGYLGSRGCRVTLMAFAAATGDPEGLEPRHDGPRLLYVWRIGETGYAILADGMDPNRFLLIAETARDATLKGLQPDERTRLALNRSRARSRPCRTT